MAYVNPGAPGTFERIEKLDRVIDPAAEVAQKVNDPDKGTLGRLVGDTTIADNIEDITEDAKGFLGTLFGMQTYVGLRSEYNDEIPGMLITGDTAADRLKEAQESGFLLLHKPVPNHRLRASIAHLIESSDKAVA